MAISAGESPVSQQSQQHLLKYATLHVGCMALGKKGVVFFEVCFWADAAMGRGRQLETQINDLTQREDAQPQRWLQTCYKGFGLDVLR